MCLEMSVSMDYKEDSGITFNCPHCGLGVKWHPPNDVHASRKHEVEINIDENVVKKKLGELEKLDFFKKIMAYTKQRQKALLSISLKKGQ